MKTLGKLIVASMLVCSVAMLGGCGSPTPESEPAPKGGDPTRGPQVEGVDQSPTMGGAPGGGAGETQQATPNTPASGPL